jgi:hypothetical protein
MPRRRKTKKRKALPRGYSAPAGSSRERLIRRAAALYKAGNKKAAQKLREQMEERERAKKSKTKKEKNKRRRRTKKKS